MPSLEAEGGGDVARSLSQACVADDANAAILSRSFDRLRGLQKPPASPEAPIPFSVWVMYFVSAMCQTAQSLTEFVIWFLIKSRGWAKDQNPEFYGLAYAISSFVPVLMNPVLGWLSHATSIRTAMAGALTVSIAGMLLTVYSFEPVHFALGYFLYSTAAIRPLRTAYIAQATEAAVRTRALAYLNLWTDGAKMMGLLSAKVWDRIAPSSAPAAAGWVWLGLELDRLNLSLFSAIGLFLLAIFTLLSVFREQHAQSAGGHTKSTAATAYTKQVTITDPRGLAWEYNGDCHARLVIAAFCVIFMLHQTSCGSVSVSNLPVLTEKLKLDEGQAANLKLVQEILGMPTPLLVAWLSRSLSDRVLFLSGILLAWAAIIIFGCPPGNTIYQPLLGMGVGHASQAFFFTAGFSLLSKVLGVRSNGAVVALLASSAAMGSTMGNLLGGRYCMKVYGTPHFFAMLIPSAWGLLLLLCPPLWRRLNLDDYLTRQLTEAWARDAAEMASLKGPTP